MSITRRRFLKTVAVSASAIALTQITGCGPGSNDTINTALRDSTFPQSLASGDPRQSSVILWTRVGLDASQVSTDSVTVQVARDQGFGQVIVDEKLSIAAAHDFCAKVRVVGLDPDTHYWYRFIHNGVASKTGRTRTLPAATADRKVKFAYTSCQDYNARYYNVYLRLLEADMDDLDFVVHLGDYIYETDRNPEFQNTSASRQVIFTDTAGAIPMTYKDGSGNTTTYYAAKSLDNYRQLYKTYRGDSVLQQIHEKFPMIAIWDDHEFSDDCWQCNGTYYDGLKGEGDITRRDNCEQAYFEYMPIDQESVAGTVTSTAGAIDVSSGELSVGTVDSTTGVGAITQGAKINRSLRVGKHVELFLTDYRTLRPDHLIPEDAFPGAVVFNTGTADPSGALDYVAFSSLAGGTQAALQGIFLASYEAEYEKGGYSASEAQTLATAKISSVLQGNLSKVYLVAAIEVAAQSDSTINAAKATLEGDIVANVAGSDGLSYYALGKNSLFSHLGSRYFVVKDSFDAYAQYRYAVDASSQNAYGSTQFQWLQQGLAQSDATWRVLASSVSLTRMILGLKSTLSASQLSALPTQFQQDFYLDLDQWDGFPNFRDTQLYPTMVPTANSANGVVTIAGDIHSSWVSDEGQGRVVFTGSSVTSETLYGLLSRQVSTLVDALAASDPTIDKTALTAQANQLLAIGDLIVEQSNSKVQLARMNEHGINVVEADANGMNVTYHQIKPVVGGLDMIGVSYYDSPQTVTDNMFTRRFRVESNYLYPL